MVATVAGGGGSSVVIAGGAQFQAAALVVSPGTPGYASAYSILADHIAGGTATLIVNGPAACPCQPNIETYLPINFVDPRCCPDSSFNILRNELSNFQPVAINNPARRPRPRSSQTLLKKNYYTTGSAYLKARVKLYEQNQLLSSVRTNQGGADFPLPGMPPAGNNYVYPISQADNNGLPDTTGTQAFYSTYCCATDISGSQTCCGVFVGADASCGTAPGCRRIPITFKPSNPFFSVQGAVDSSTRTLQKRYATITKNNLDFSKPKENSPRPDSLLVPYDATAARHGYVSWFTPTVRLPGSTPTTYRGVTSAPYFIKSNYQALNGTDSIIKLTRVGARMPSGGTGIRTVCYSCGPPLCPEDPCHLPNIDLSTLDFGAFGTPNQGCVLCPVNITGDGVVGSGVVTPNTMPLPLQLLGPSPVPITILDVQFFPAGSVVPVPTWQAAMNPTSPDGSWGMKYTVALTPTSPGSNFYITVINCKGEYATQNIKNLTGGIIPATQQVMACGGTTGAMPPPSPAFVAIVGSGQPYRFVLSR